MDSETYVQHGMLIDYADSFLATRLSLVEQCCLLSIIIIVWSSQDVRDMTRCVPCLFRKSA